MSQRVLSFHYTLTNNQGQPLDSSRGKDPLTILEDSKMILPALEKELFQMGIGDTKKVELKAADAYGTIDEGLKGKIKSTQLPEEGLAVGARLQTGPEQGNRIFMVTKIEGEDVYVDGNHPLAGVDLNFDVEVVEMRDATEEEIANAQKGCCSDPNCDENEKK